MPFHCDLPSRDPFRFFHGLRIKARELRDVSELPEAIAQQLSDSQALTGLFTLAVLNPENGSIEIPVRRWLGVEGDLPQSSGSEDIDLVASLMSSGDPLELCGSSERDSGAFIGYPIISQGNCLGAIALSMQTSNWGEAQRASLFLEAIAEIYCDAYSHLHLLACHQQALEKQNRMMELVTAVNASTDLREVLLLVRNTFVEECGFDRAGVFLWDPACKVMRGTWGTDTDGRLEDIYHLSLPLDEASAKRWAVEGNESQDGYLIIEDCCKEGCCSADMEHVRAHGVVHLRANGEPVGFIGVDNLLTGRDISREDVEQLLPFAHQAAAAIQKAKLLEERQRTSKRQKRLMELAATLNSSRDLSNVLMLVRNTVVEECGFDRAGLFLFDADNQVMRGTWGTDREGQLQDISSYSIPLDEVSAELWGINNSGEGPGYVKVSRCGEQKWSHQDASMRKVEDHAIVHLRANGKTVGFIGVDNLISQRSISDQDVIQLLPFAHQAAAAIEKAQILEDRQRRVNQQRRLMEMSVAIGANQDLDRIFELVRVAVLETKIVDRVAFWVADGDIARGTYGTDIDGNPRDEHHRSFKLDDDWLSTHDQSVGNGWIKISQIEPKVWYDGKYREAVPHAVVAVKSGSKLVGFLTVDNALTGRAITREGMEMLLPFTEQAAVAIEKAALLRAQELAMNRQRRFMLMAAAISEQQDLTAIFRLATEAMIETGWVDRVSLWLFQDGCLCGSAVVDEHGHFTERPVAVVPIQACSIVAQEVVSSEISYSIGVSYTDHGDVGEQQGTFPHAVLALRAGGELQGIISLDTIRSGRPITPEYLEQVLPFADQIAVAILNAKLVKETQEELERRRIAENELRLYAAELVKARDEALQATKIKSQFLANMSHEIRTPLNGVIGMTSLLLESDLKAVQREYLQTVQNSSESLLAIINDILDFSKIEAGKMLIENVEFDLRKCVEDVADLMSVRLGKKQLELNVVIPPEFPESLCGDEMRIRQILTNLAGNAIKFTEEGEVTIGAQLVSVSGSSATVRLEVCDSGIGISKDRHESIFESFTQADGSMTRRFGGTGLGLTLTKQLSELMGGKTGVDSAEGIGSTFWVELPLEIAKSSNSIIVPKEVSRAKILVVDSNDTARRLLKEQLSFWGCQVSAHEDLAQAGKELALRTERFDLILVEAKCEVQELERYASCAESPVVFMVARCSADASLVGYEKGYAQVLWKPFRRQQIFQLLSNLLAPVERVVKIPKGQDQWSDLGMKILVAEDNEVNSLLLRRYLSSLGCEATCVVNGLELIRAFKSEQFDLILMDVQMPIMDGLEATGKLRELEANMGHRTPVIALTAHAQQGDRERCLEAGMDDYLSKPILRKDLGQKLHEWMCKQVVTELAA